MNEEAAMNAYTIPSRHTNAGKLGRLLLAFRTEIRRAIELVGASYRYGPHSPL
jgi:hypothetical protein